MLFSKRSYCLLLFSIVLLAHASATFAGISVGISIDVAPPAMPVYEQPVCPDAGYLWAPGYWAYGDDGYYWVPGTWVLAPEPNLLWTPGYWGWSDGYYVWHEGYWGRHVGFYGGVNYGYGYTGVGFYGGYWRSGVYSYNRSVTNVNVAVVHSTYVRPVATTVTPSRISYNGGTGGIVAKPTAKELVAVRERHIPATVQQTQHVQAAAKNHELLATENHGQPSAEVLAKHAAATPTTSNAVKAHSAHAPRREHSRPEQDPRQHERHER